MCVSCQKKTQQPKTQNYESVFFWFTLVLDLFDGISGKKFLFDCSIKTIFLKSKSCYFFGTIFDVKFCQYFSCFFFIKMMNNEMLSYILSSGFSNPTLTTRMSIDIFCQIIDFVFDNPKLFFVGCPQLLIPSPFLFHPNRRRGAQPSTGEAFPFLGSVNNLKSHKIISQLSKKPKTPESPKSPKSPPYIQKQPQTKNWNKPRVEDK